MAKFDYRTIPDYFKTPSDEFRLILKNIIVDLRKSGVPNKKIAMKYSMHESVVSKYWGQYKKGGKNALQSNTRGRKKGEQKKLSILDERNIIVGMINAQPLYDSKEQRFWNIESVRDFINRENNIDIAIPTVANYLRQWKLTYELNTISAEIHSQNIVNWFAKVFPDIKKRAKNEQAEIIRVDGIHRVKFPDLLLKKTKEYSKWKVKCYQMKIVASYGTKSFILSSKRFNAYDLIDFFERLTQFSNNKVYLILNMKKLYPMKPLKEWLNKNHNKIEVYYVPQ